MAKQYEVNKYEEALKQEAKCYGVCPGPLGMVGASCLSGIKWDRASWIHRELNRLDLESEQASWDRLRALAAKEPGATEPPE